MQTRTPTRNNATRMLCKLEHQSGTTITLKRNPSLRWTGIPRTHSYLDDSTFVFTSWNSTTGEITLTETGANGDVHVSTVLTAGMIHSTSTMIVRDVRARISVISLTFTRTSLSEVLDHQSTREYSITNTSTLTLEHRYKHQQIIGY